MNKIILFKNEGEEILHLNSLVNLGNYLIRYANITEIWENDIEYENYKQGINFDNGLQLIYDHDNKELCLYIPCELMTLTKQLELCRDLREIALDEINELVRMV